jgi:hypothetical protein
MTRSGHADAGLLAAIGGAFLGVVASLYFWGFCVDDALIPIRYAQNFVSGHGYAMSAGARPSDGVTPLPWTFLIAPLCAGASAWTALARLKVLGIALHGVTCALVARRVAAELRERLWAAAILLVGMALATPLAAWAASGMEVEVAALLVAYAVAGKAALHKRALAAGLAATMRPELGAFAVAFAIGDAIIVSGASPDPRKILWRAVRPQSLLLAMALGAGPFAAVAVARALVFGHAAPLSVAAKPSDLSHGLLYAGAAAIASAAPVAAFAPLAIARDARARALAIACIVHLLAVVAVGGDSMPLARLLVPAAPAFIVVAARVAASASVPFVVLRAVLVLGVDAFGLVKWAPDARRTLDDREKLATDAAPLLEGAHAVATVDVGWVATATDATLVDLAGVTDPEIAFLRGGHTSKAVSPSLLESRGTDALVFLEKDGAPARVVEARLLATPFVTDHFEKRATLPIGKTGLSYAIYLRKK